MRNIKVTMCYRGTNYHGFQRQDNAIAIQQIVEEKLSKILGGEDVTIYGCSRTDTGVHALEYCFSFKTERTIPLLGLKRGLNSELPKDISIVRGMDSSISIRQSIREVAETIFIAFFWN